MAIHARTFDREKAVEAIVFIAKLLPEPTKHSISKMLYFSDKLHLQEYGRPICGDRYVAMEYGPVPSSIYDMMKVPTGQKRIDPDIDEWICEAFKVVHYSIVPLRDADESFFSESEIECIQETIAEYGRKSFGQLSDLSHDSAWNATDENQPIELLNIVKTLPNAAEIISYFEHH